MESATEFKQSSPKEWLTPFGLVRIERRYFQPDEGGDGVAAIDLRCGMSGRYMTPDLEEATALASADLSPSATRELLGKVLVRAQSEKVIRRVVADVGQWAEGHSHTAGLKSAQPSIRVRSRYHVLSHRHYARHSETQR